VRPLRQARLVRPVPDVAAGQRAVFTVAQARAAGWTRSAMRHAVSCGDLVVLRPGVLARPAEPTGFSWLDERDRHARTAAAALLSRPRSLASHCSAAVLMDLPVLEVPEVPCLTVLPSHSGAVRGVHLHRTRLDAGDPGRLRGLRLTMPARTVVDIARERGVVAGVVTADGALHRGLLTARELKLAVRAAAGRAGVERARAAAALADGRAESALESRSRLAIADADLPPPDLQPDIFVDGRFAGRVDFYWDEFGVIGEADGWEKYKPGWERIRDEKRRQEQLERGRLIVVRWGSDDLASFAPVTDRLRDAFTRGLGVGRPERRWTVRTSALPTRVSS
jgi:hypothetical protein